jgi:hypothetical protein
VFPLLSAQAAALSVQPATFTGSGGGVTLYDLFASSTDELGVEPYESSSLAWQAGDVTTPFTPTPSLRESGDDTMT